MDAIRTARRRMVEDFIVRIGDGRPRNAMKPNILKLLAARRITEFEIFDDPSFYHGNSGNGPLAPSR